MNKEPIISIVIPCYNDEKFIEQAIYSALNQTYENKEVIIVDDGSNLFTKEILEKIKPKVTKLITQENKGQSSARNIGIKEACGEYILVLDSDDFFEPTFCAKAIEIFNQKKDVKIVTCYANIIFEKSKPYVLKPKGGDILNFLCDSSALGTSMFKKIDWKSCGGYDENMINGFEDWEFFIRLLANGGVVEVINEPLYNYRRRNGSTTTKAKQHKYELLKYIFIKNQELYKLHFETFITCILKRIENEEKEKINIKRKLEFKIGSLVLKPIRKIKFLLKKSSSF